MHYDGVCTHKSSRGPNEGGFFFSEGTRGRDNAGEGRVADCGPGGERQLLKDKSQINIYPVGIIIIIGLRGIVRRGGEWVCAGRGVNFAFIISLLFDRKPQISVLPASERRIVCRTRRRRGNDEKTPF